MLSPDSDQFDVTFSSPIFIVRANKLELDLKVFYYHRESPRLQLKIPQILIRNIEGNENFEFS